MPSLILLSSSPPRIFARTPTPIGLSSPSRSEHQLEGQPSFRPISSHRDGFSNSFVHKRGLQNKQGAENRALNDPTLVPNAIAFKQKTFSPSPPEALNRKTKFLRESPSPSRDRAQGEAVALKDNIEKTDQQQDINGTVNDNDIEAGLRLGEPSCQSDAEIIIRDNEVERCIASRAIPRRLDWTPVKITEASDPGSLPDAEGLCSFSETLSNRFAYAPNQDDDVECLENNRSISKRRRLNLINPGKKDQDQEEKSVSKTKTIANPKRRVASKSTSKKSLTITSLSTSLYANPNSKPQPDPISQLLNASQLQHGEGILGDLEKSAITQKSRKSNTKTKPKGRLPSESRLLSPESAIRVWKDQDAFFGSASQLAREHSPSLPFNKVEALKPSYNILSSNTASPQPTQPVSIESTTPKALKGTGRYLKTKNLWAAAGRDEDNALLHVDVVDLSDTPHVRLALAGKDVLLESTSVAAEAYKFEVPGWRPNLGPRSSGLRPIPLNLSSVVDCAAQRTEKTSEVGPREAKRGIHTSTEAMSLRSLGDNDTADLSMIPVEREQALGAKNKKDLPTKPNYVGFSTDDLRKQISAYGFKAIRKRERMIEVLDKCWADQHLDLALVKDNDESGDPEIRKHGDLLTDVHAISSRPVPKTKRTPRKRGKAKDAEDAVKKSAKTPRNRRAKGQDAGSIALDKKSTGIEQAIVDVDDIESVQVKQKNQSQNNVGGLHTEQTSDIINSNFQRNNPLTVLKELPPDLSTKLGDASVRDVNVALASPDRPLELPDISQQINAAILQESRQARGTGRNHVKNPTWQEKILLYDPVILEDFTNWLNTQGFSQIHEDREVSALEVRSWCESNGVCCLWKASRRGQRRRGQEE